MTKTQTHRSIMIVGGGLAGLSAAALLARAGYAVTLFEKAATPGGRARTKQRNGFCFNQGAHAFYLGGPGEQLLGELGISVSGAEPDRSRYFALDGGKVHVFPLGVRSLLRTGLLNVAAKAEFVRLFRRLQQKEFTALHDVSLQDWLEKEVQQRQVRQVVLAGVRTATYTNAPDLLSAGLALPLLTSHVRYLDNGWQTLVDQLRQTAQEAGARIMTQARVAAVEVAREGYVLRLGDGTSYAASVVLLATDPETASALVLEGTHQDLSRWAAQAIPARVACLDIALRRLPRPQNLVTFGIDRSFYYSVHSASARLAPQGKALIHTMKYLRPDESVEPEATRRELEALMDLVQPGWRAEVEDQQFLPHIIASNAIVQARHDGLQGRPGPTVPGLPNLYVIGDWVGMVGQLADACFASAGKAARMIMATETANVVARS